jgi:hypothetical protein
MLSANPLKFCIFLIFSGKHILLPFSAIVEALKPNAPKAAQKR